MTPFTPKIGQYYWYIETVDFPKPRLTPLRTVHRGSLVDHMRFRSGNSFRTRKDTKELMKVVYEEYRQMELK